MIPNGVTTLERYTFSMCPGLQKVTFPRGLEVIGEGCFWCTGLVEVALPGSVRYIADGAFAGCMALRAMWVPAGAEVAPSAFGGGAPGELGDRALNVADGRGAEEPLAE